MGNANPELRTQDYGTVVPSSSGQVLTCLLAGFSQICFASCFPPTAPGLV